MIEASRFSHNLGVMYASGLPVHTALELVEEIVQAVQEQTQAAAHVADLMESVSRGVEIIRGAGEEQKRGNEVVMNSTTAVRDVAQQGVAVAGRAKYVQDRRLDVGA